jgi:triphosphatase
VPATSLEIELKLKVDRKDIARLRRRLEPFGPARSLQLESRYFDTPQRALAAAGYALRVRRTGRGSTSETVQTLKRELAAGALAQRREWQTIAPDGRLDLARFPADALPAGLDAGDLAALRPLFTTRFQRSTWTVAHAQATLEVALDEGEIRAGTARSPLCELEIEVLAGGGEAAISFALELLGAHTGSTTGSMRRGLALRPAVESKAERGLKLAGAPDPQARPAATPADAGAVAAGIGPGDDVANAVRRVVANTCSILLRNATGIESSDEPEFVHQARVCLRRLRECLRLLGDAAGFPAPLLDELSFVARGLGTARDADVLALETLPAIIGALGRAPANQVEHTARLAARARSRARADLRRLIASPRFARLALDLLAWSASPPPATLPAAGRKLQTAAPQAARKEYKRWLDSVRHAARMTIRERHRARLSTKRLRYALELLQAASPETAQRWLRGLRKLQDQLGEYQNAAVAVAALRRHQGPSSWRSRLEQQLVRRMKDAASRSLPRLRKLRRAAPPVEG